MRADTIIARLTQANAALANAALAQRVPEQEAPASPDRPREARGSPERGAEVGGSEPPTTGSGAAARAPILVAGVLRVRVRRGR